MDLPSTPHQHVANVSRTAVTVDCVGCGGQITEFEKLAASLLQNENKRRMMSTMNATSFFAVIFGKKSAVLLVGSHEPAQMI